MNVAPPRLRLAGRTARSGVCLRAENRFSWPLQVMAVLPLPPPPLEAVPEHPLASGLRRRPIGIDLPDEELVRRVLTDDAWAKEAFYRKHVELVFRTSLRLVGSRSDAEDVVQDSFAEAFRDLKKLREPAAARAWLLRIAVHRAHKLFRRRKLLRILGLDRNEDASLAAFASPGASPETRFELLCVDRALAQVGAAARSAWLLRYVEGHGLQEVAELTGCSLATVKRRISAAARAVERELGETVPGEVPDDSSPEAAQ